MKGILVLFMMVVASVAFGEKNKGRNPEATPVEKPAQPCRSVCPTPEPEKEIKCENRRGCTNR